MSAARRHRAAAAADELERLKGILLAVTACLGGAGARQGKGTTRKLAASMSERGPVLLVPANLPSACAADTVLKASRRLVSYYFSNGG